MATWRHPDDRFPDWQEQLEPLRRILRRWGRGRVVWLALAVIVLLWLASGFYVVRPAERADLPPEVQASVFARMQAERQRIAMRYRAEGEEKAREIRAGADKEREIILARAYSTSQRQRGEGDAQATAVTGRAFGQDAGFYAFLRRLETYERIFADGSTTILLRPDSDLLRYLESPRPRR